MASSTAVSGVITARNFDINKISFAKPKKLDTGGVAIYVNYAGGGCNIQSPWMKAPWGVKEWPNENGRTKVNLDLSFEGHETNEELGIFYKALASIDERMVKDGMENSQLWFKKKFASDEVVKNNYTPLIRFAKDKTTGEINTTFPPTLKMTIPRDKEGRLVVNAFGDKRQELDINEVMASKSSVGARVQAIFQISSIWMVNGSFGLTCKVKQVRIKETSNLSSGFAFVKTEGDDDDEEDFAGPAPAVVRRLPGGSAGPSGSKNKDDDGMLPESDEEPDAAHRGGGDDEGLEPDV